MLKQINLTIDPDLLTNAREDLSRFTDFKTSLNQPTGRFFYDEWKLKNEYKKSTWETILDLLPYKKGEARIIKLDIKSCYAKHADIDDRWHLNLGNDHSFLVNLDNDNLCKVEPGIWYTMDAGVLHSAVNFSDEPRYHLVVRKLLPINDLQDPIKINLKVVDESTHYRYVMDNKLSSFMNRKSKEKKLSNFYVETDKNMYFELERTEIQSLNQIIESMNLKIEVNVQL